MKSDADRCSLGWFVAVVRCARVHNGDAESSCMRTFAQIPLYYPDSPRVKGALTENWFVSTGMFDDMMMEG
jgi:hypothetical protein